MECACGIGTYKMISPQIYAPLFSPAGYRLPLVGECAVTCGMCLRSRCVIYASLFTPGCLQAVSRGICSGMCGSLWDVFAECAVAFRRFDSLWFCPLRIMSHVIRVYGGVVHVIRVD